MYANKYIKLWFFGFTAIQNQEMIMILYAYIYFYKYTLHIFIYIYAYLPIKWFIFYIFYFTSRYHFQKINFIQMKKHLLSLTKNKLNIRKANDQAFPKTLWVELYIISEVKVIKNLYANSLLSIWMLLILALI